MRSLTRPLLLPLALLLGFSAPSSAVTFYWATARCTNLSFSFTANCWTQTEGSAVLSGVPPSDAGNSLSIRNTGDNLLNVNYTAATGQRSYSWLALDTPGTGLTTFSMSGGSLEFSSRSSIGQVGGGRFRIKGGTARFADLTLGGASTASGAQLLLSETGLVVADSLQVGQRGEATVHLTENSGLSVQGLLSLGSLAGGRGSLLLEGGLLTTSELRVGDAGQGSVLQSGGTLNTSSLSLASAAGSQGSYALNGGRLSVTGDLLSPNGTGALSINGGELAVGGQIQLARFDVGSQGRFALAAGKTMDVQQAVLMDGLLILAGQASWASGASGHGTLQLAGGELLGSGPLVTDGAVQGQGRIGGTLQWQANGEVVVSGGALRLANGNGNGNGNGNRNVSSGSWRFENGGSLVLENGSALRNRGQFSFSGATVQGNGLLVNERDGVMSGAGNVLVPFNNAGSLVLESGRLRLAQGLANAGDLQLLGPIAQLTGAQIGNGGLIIGQGRIDNSVANQGGRVQARGGLLVLGGGVNNLDGVLTVDDGATLRLANVSQGNSGRIELAGGTFDTAGQAFDNTGAISGSGVWRSGLVTQRGQLQLASGLLEWHAGLQLLPGSRSIVSGHSRWVVDGPVEVQGGAELRVSEGASATFFGDVNLRSGALLTGTGWKFFEGALSLGNSPARLQDAGSVRLGEGSTYLAELGAEGHDQLQVGGQLQFGGTLRLVALAGTSFAAGQQFDLFDWGLGSSGRFAQLDFSAAVLPQGLAWDRSRLYQDGVLGVMGAVPEPGAAWLLALGLATLSLRTRRR